MSYILKDAYELSVWDEELVAGSWVDENNKKVEPDTPGALHLLEHYRERKIAIIGADDMDTPFAANSPILTVNTNGTVTLTFKMFYHCYDEDKGKEGEFATNPYVGLLSNERKIKLKFRNKWYDFIIRNCQESSENHTFTYTARSIYVNELAKNGLKVELDDELENNQGSITELAEYILADSDWQVAPTAPIIRDDNDTTLYSDIIVETRLDPIYPAILNTDIDVKVVSDYLPDATLGNKDYLKIEKIKKGEQVFFFYSDLMDKNPLPHILYRPKEFTGEEKVFYANKYYKYDNSYNKEKQPDFLYRDITNISFFQPKLKNTEYSWTYNFKQDNAGIYRRNYNYKITTFERIPDGIEEKEENRYSMVSVEGETGCYYKVTYEKLSSDGYEIIPREDWDKYSTKYYAERIETSREKIMDYLYQTDINKDIITNAYNYRLLREIDYQEVETTANVPEIVDYTSDEDFTVSKLYRGEKVVRSPETGYDPDIDEFITKYVPYEYIKYSHGEYGYLEEKDKYFKLYKYVEDENGTYYYIKSEEYFTIEEPENYTGLKYRKELDNDSSAFVIGDYVGKLYRRKIVDRELYGYIHTEDYSPYLAENYLSNSQEVTSFEEGWVFDGTPTTKDDASSGNVTDEEDGTFTGQVYLLNTKLPADDTEAPETPRGVLVLRLRDGETMYPDATGEYIKFIEKKDGETEEVRYIEYTDDLIQDILSDLYADAKVNRENGVDGFVGKTDQQLEDIVNSAITKMRYSKRRHRAINTGVAANRKTISTFTPGEKYVFAISLGRYKDGEGCPLYYTELSPDATEEEIERNTLKYGATAPQHLYSFIEEDEIKKKAAQITKETVDKDMVKNPERYILPEWIKPDEDKKREQNYSKVWDSIYNEYYNAYLNNYLKDNYLIDSLEFIDLGKKQKDALEKVWNYGGFKYRDYFNDTLIQNLQAAIIKKLSEDEEVSWAELFEDSFKATADIKYPDLDQQDALEIDYIQEFIQFESDFQEAFGIAYEDAEKIADEESESKWFLPEWTTWRQFGNSKDKEIHGYTPIPQYEDYGMKRFLDGYYNLFSNNDKKRTLFLTSSDDGKNHGYKTWSNNGQISVEGKISRFNSFEQDWTAEIISYNSSAIVQKDVGKDQLNAIVALIQDAGHSKEQFLKDFNKYFFIDRNKVGDFFELTGRKITFEHLKYILNYVSRKKYIYLDDNKKLIKFKYKVYRDYGTDSTWSGTRYFEDLNFLSKDGKYEGTIEYNSYASELQKRIIANLEKELGNPLSVSSKETDTFKEKFFSYFKNHTGKTDITFDNLNNITTDDKEELYIIKGLIHSKWGQDQPLYNSNKDRTFVDSKLNSKPCVKNFLRGFNAYFKDEFMPSVRDKIKVNGVSYEDVDIRPTFEPEQEGWEGLYDGDYIEVNEGETGAIEGSDGKFYKKITIWQKSYLFNRKQRYIMKEAPLPGYFGSLKTLTEKHKIFILTWYSEREKYQDILKTVVKKTNFNLYREVFKNQIEYNNSYDLPGIFNSDGGKMYQREINHYNSIATECANIQAIAESLEAHRTGGWKYLLGLMFMRDETENELKRQIDDIKLDTKDAKWKVGGVNYNTALEDRYTWTKGEDATSALPAEEVKQGYTKETGIFDKKEEFIGLTIDAGHYAGFDRWINTPSVINEGKIKYWPDDLPKPWNGQSGAPNTISVEHTNFGQLLDKSLTNYNDWRICGKKYIEYFEKAFDKIYTDELRTSSYVLDKDEYKIINFPDLNNNEYVYAVPIDYNNPNQRRYDVPYYVIDHKNSIDNYQYQDFCRLFKKIFNADFLVDKEEFLEDNNGKYKWYNNKFVKIEDNENYKGQRYRLATNEEIQASIKESLIEDKAKQYFEAYFYDIYSKGQSTTERQFDASKDGSYIEYGIIHILQKLNIDIIDFRKQFKKEFGYSFYEIIENDAEDDLDWNHRYFIKKYISSHSAYIRLFNPDTDMDRNIYLAVSNNKEGYYVVEEAENYGIDVRTLNASDYEITQRLKMDGMEHYRPYKGKTINENGVVYYNDVIFHETALFDGKIGEWEEIPPRYDFSRTFHGVEDRLFLELEPQDAFYEEFHGAQLTQMQEDKDGYYIYSGDVKKSLIKTWWEESAVPNAKDLGEKIESFFEKLFYREEEAPVTDDESGGPVSDALKEAWRGFKGFFVTIGEGVEAIVTTVADGIADIIEDTLKSTFKTLFNKDWSEFLESGLSIEDKNYESENNYIENQISFNLTTFKDLPESGDDSDSLFSGIVLPTWLVEKEKFKKNYGRSFREDWDKLSDKIADTTKARRTINGNYLRPSNRNLTRKQFIIENIVARYMPIYTSENIGKATATLRKMITNKFYEEFTKLASDQTPYYVNDAKGKYTKVDEFSFRELTSEEMEELGENYRDRYSFEVVEGSTYFDLIKTITQEEKDFILTFLCLPFRSLVDIADADIETDGRENFYHHELYINSFIKYKWWYWRHWGKKRYSKRPKIYVHSPKNSDLDVYYPYNKYKDVGPQNYIIFDTLKEAEQWIRVNGYKNNEILTIKLNNQEYRIIKENDYEGYRYKRRTVNKMGEEYYVLDETYNYYRPYSKGTGYIGDGKFGKDGDGRVDFGDGHFGKWVQCYEFYRDEDGDFIYINGLYIPYDPRLYGRSKRYKKIIDAKGNFVSSDGRYILLDEYIRRYTKEFRLDYRNLSSSFCDNYEYDSLYFAIDLNTANLNSGELTNNGFYNNDKYLNFDFNNEPAGFYETTYQEATILEPEIKERWVYWIGTVNDNFSLTEDLLSKIGMVFQVEKDENGEINNLNKTEKNNINFALLGSQMFKYYPYTPTKDEDDVIEPEETLVIPGVAPDTKDLIVTSYYIYDPLETKDIDSIKYHYVGQDPFDKYSYLYDETCQKIRSIKGKEKNYYNLLQDACKTFNCWVDFQVEHNENGEIVYRNENLYKQNNYLPNSIGTFYKVKEVRKDKDGKITEKIIYKELIDGKTDFFVDKEVGTDTTITHSQVDKPLRYYICEKEPLLYINKVPYDSIGKYINDEDVLKADDIQYIKDSLGGYYQSSEGQYDLIPEGLYPEITYRKELKPSKEEINHRKRKAAMAILGEASKEEWLEPWENLKTYKFEDFFYKELIRVPKKTVVFKRYVGKENWTGFKYGVNLKSIQRTLDSEQIVSKIVIKSNKNEHAKDGMCTVQRAKENPIKENFAYNFDYYIRQEMLDKSILDADLYQGYGDKLNYYNTLARLNRNNDEIAERLAALSIQIDKLRADYEVAVLARDAAEEEIAHLAETLNNNYDSYGQLIDTPWTFNKAKQYASRNTTTTQGYEKEVSVVQDNGEVYNYMVYVEEQVATVDYPLYNDQLRNLFNQMDEHMRNQNVYGVEAKDLKGKLEKAEKEYEDLVKQQAHIVEKKNGLNKLFFHKYSRFIQEGSWNSEEYIDDNLYYLDGLSTLRGSISPKVSYTIQVVDLSKLEGYEVLSFEIGDKTYIEDPEFFGYNPITGKPYQEEIIINEIAYNLEDPGATQIKVANFSSQFENLFQRAAATANTLQLNQGTYGSGSRLMNADGSVNTSVIQSTIANATDILSAATSENVYWDNTGITVTSTKTASSIVKIVSQGILISSDGGNHFTTAITGSGVNAALLTAGKLNVDKVIIGASSTPNFLWDRNGITAFRRSINGIDYSTFVRMDEYGIYGITGFSKNNIPIDKMSINEVFEPGNDTTLIKEWASFGLTWDGFFLNTGTGNDKGRVVIGTGQDLRMSSFLPETEKWLDRVIIGKLKDKDGNEYYGFRLTDKFGRINLDTDKSGELYLRRKLRISNFTTNKVYPMGQDKTVYQNVEYDDWNEDRVTLGIVETYKRSGSLNNGNLSFEPAKEVMDDDYSSADYLTKVFSIRTNSQLKLEPFKAEHIEQVIDKTGNETFAIFDNGNLYARNAWVEGRIDATGGSITGNMDVTGLLKLGGQEEGKYIYLNGNIGMIYTSDYRSGESGWMISPLLAEFENGKFRGTLLDTIVETVHVQTIGGAVMLAKSGTIRKINKIYEYYNGTIDCEVIVEDQNLFKEDFQLMKDDPELTTNITEAEENEKNLESFNEESLIETQEVIIRVRLELTELPYYCYSGKFEKLHKMNSTKAINKDNFRNYGKFRRIKMAEEILFEDTDCTKLFITLENEDELKSLEEDYGIVLYRGKEDVYGVTNVDTGALGIVGSRDDAGITLSTTEISDQDGILLNRAIHIFDVIPEKGDDSDGGVKTRVLLGKIPNEEKYGSIKNKNGLYAENVLVKGSLATQTVSSYSGISSDAKTIPLYRGAVGLEVNEKPIFWVASWDEYALEVYKSYLTNLVNYYHGLEEDNYIFDTKNNRWKTNEEVKSNIAANVDQTELINNSIGAIFVKNLLKEIDEWYGNANDEFLKALSMLQADLQLFIMQAEDLNSGGVYWGVENLLLQNHLLLKKYKGVSQYQDLYPLLQLLHSTAERGYWDDDSYQEISYKLNLYTGIFNKKEAAILEFTKYKEESYEKTLEYLLEFIFEKFKEQSLTFLNENALSHSNTALFWISTSGKIYSQELLSKNGLFFNVKISDNFYLYNQKENLVQKEPLEEAFLHINSQEAKSSISNWGFFTAQDSLVSLTQLPNWYENQGIPYDSNIYKSVHILDCTLKDGATIKKILTPGLTLTTSRDSSKTFEGKILEIGNDGFAIYGVSENESKTFVSSMEFNIDNYDLALVKNRNNKNSVDFAFGVEKSVLNTEKLYFSETYIIEKVSEGINEIIF